jgi:Ca2+-binding RTX toxin-like protein
MLVRTRGIAVASIVGRRESTRILGIAVGLLLLSGLGAVPALAVTTCGFSAPTMTVMMFADGDAALVDVAGGAIRVNGLACQGATVTNTDTIDVSTDNLAHADDNIVTISHAGGKFQPGATLEGSGTLSEIEWNITLGAGMDALRFVGTSGVDWVAVGSGGGNAALNLNANENAPDVDVQFGSGVESIRLSGYDGGDVLVADGGYATGAAYPKRVVLHGGNQADYLAGGTVNDHIFGGPGGDEIHGRNGNDTIAGGGQIDVIYGEAGNDTLIGDAGDDNLYGIGGNDLIIGDAGFDKMFGGVGVDTLKAKDGEKDYVEGGPPSTVNGDRCYVSSTDTVNTCEYVY